MPTLPPSDLIYALGQIRQLVAEHDPELLPAWAAAAQVTAGTARRRQRVLINRQARQLRDWHLRQAAALLDVPTPTEKAVELGKRIVQYRRSSWPAHATRATCPAEISGTVDGNIWAALKFDARCPTSRRQLFTIIAGK
jgi:hypothetical protein